MGGSREIRNVLRMLGKNAGRQLRIPVSRRSTGTAGRKDRGGRTADSCIGASPWYDKTSAGKRNVYWNADGSVPEKTRRIF